MQAGDDAMMVVRAELDARLDTLRGHCDRDCARGIVESADTIRLIAAAYGLHPVARLAEALSRAARDRRAESACPPALYLARLRDAIGCDRRDEEAGEVMLASVSVRLCA